MGRKLLHALRFHCSALPEGEPLHRAIGLGVEGHVRIHYRQEEPVRRSAAAMHHRGLSSAMAASSGAKWIVVAFTSRNRYEISDLEPGKDYTFRVMAIGSFGASQYTEDLTVRAA